MIKFSVFVPIFFKKFLILLEASINILLAYACTLKQMVTQFAYLGVISRLITHNDVYAGDFEQSLIIGINCQTTEIAQHGWITT